MSQTFLYKIFKIGQIPQHLLAQIKSEGIVLKAEGIGGSITYKKFRAPGRYSHWKKSGFSGSIILTQEHFLAFQFSHQIIGVAWKHEKIDCLNCSLENENTLAIEFEASNFHENQSGHITVRFFTPLAPLFWQQIRDLRTRYSS